MIGLQLTQNCLPNYITQCLFHFDLNIQHLTSKFKWRWKTREKMKTKEKKKTQKNDSKTLLVYFSVAKYFWIIKFNETEISSPLPTNGKPANKMIGGSRRALHSTTWEGLTECNVGQHLQCSSICINVWILNWQCPNKYS